MHVLFMTVQIAPTTTNSTIAPIHGSWNKSEIVDSEFRLERRIDDIRRSVEGRSGQTNRADPDCADWT